MAIQDYDIVADRQADDRFTIRRWIRGNLMKIDGYDGLYTESEMLQHLDGLRPSGETWIRDSVFRFLIAAPPILIPVVRTINCDGEKLTVRADTSTDPKVWRIFGVVTNAADEFVVVAPLRSLQMSDEELVKAIRAAKANLSPPIE